MYSQKNWVGMCGPLPKSLNLFMTKICDFPYPIYDQTLRSLGEGLLLLTFNEVEEGKARMGKGRRDEEVASSKKTELKTRV